MTDPSMLLSKAHDYMYSNARLLDRRRYEFHFGNGSAEAVIDALRPYQNADGGFGGALEPDIRDPLSQPVPTELALHVMDEVGLFDSRILEGVRLYLKNLAVSGTGGFPRALRSINQAPHAPWWQTEDDTGPSLNPTGLILAKLYKQQAVTSFYEEEWFLQSDAYFRANMHKADQKDYHDVIQCIAFVEHAPADATTEQMRELLKDWLKSEDLVQRNPNAEGYVQKVVDWFPAPDCFGASDIPEEIISSHLDALIAQQQEDGGWMIPWPALSPACLSEWRGMITVNKLLTLKAYGRL
ncbi:hypothetical protein [Paenibacillus pinihumi]|uniref:hypothetical protein n=1 Tax=Paenibacillus pinihumi TaxID=669462 RepID=UPI00041A6F86|nr:hypothetical protein [Paenibacillus pinihumi]